MRLLVIACVVACSSPQPQPTPARPDPAPSPSAVEDTVPAGGYAQPPPGGPPATPASLPRTGPECRSCPPAPMYPTEDCADGMHIGGRGPCVRFADGSCNWTGLVCPAPAAGAACGPADCALPDPAEWLCPDGKTVARFTCVRSRQGTCGATYRPCRGAAMAPPPAPPPPPPPPARGCDPLPSDRVLATWKIDEVCGPGQGPAPPPRKHFKTLPDGTHIIEQLGRCMRVRYRRCNTKCLPPETRIATPAGDVRLRDVRIGSAVWTRDASGRRVAVRVERVIAAPITGVHHVARVVLADGRTLIASPEHPVLGDRIVQELRAGDPYDGSSIVNVKLVRYTRDFTYDVLPAGATGIYWADGVPVRSTLR